MGALVQGLHWEIDVSIRNWSKDCSRGIRENKASLQHTFDVWEYREETIKQETLQCFAALHFPISKLGEASSPKCASAPWKVQDLVVMSDREA